MLKNGQGENKQTSDQEKRLKHQHVLPPERLRLVLWTGSLPAKLWKLTCGHLPGSRQPSLEQQQWVPCRCAHIHRPTPVRSSPALPPSQQGGSDRTHWPKRSRQQTFLPLHPCQPNPVCAFCSWRIHAQSASAGSWAWETLLWPSAFLPICATWMGRCGLETAAWTLSFLLSNSNHSSPCCQRGSRCHPRCPAENFWKVEYPEDLKDIIQRLRNHYNTKVLSLQNVDEIQYAILGGY